MRGLSAFLIKKHQDELLSRVAVTQVAVTLTEVFSWGYNIGEAGPLAQW